ncbi:MAG: hypothetical protein OEW15_07385 [Nitrospirota bacterium]|nr:hypothetical protein [Nitrospirota bacterium]
MIRYKKLILLLVVFGSIHLLFTSIAGPALSKWLFEQSIESKLLPTNQATYLIAFFQYAAIIIWIPVSIWIYKDSKKELFAPLLWSILVLIAHYQGLIIYLLVLLLTDKERVSECKF